MISHHRMSVVLAAAVIACVSACSTPSTGPYAAATDRDRNPLEAQRLNAEAAEFLVSDPARAETLLRESLTHDLYHGPAHNNLGVLYLAQNRLYEAAGEFEWARKLMPGHPDPRLNLGLALERAGRIEEALASYRTALEVYPNHIASLQALARAQLRHNRTDETTSDALRQIAMRGESEQWRQWARAQLTQHSPDSLGPAGQRR